jgi:RNA polymerase sigma-70 factor (ECF subfamily)
VTESGGEGVESDGAVVRAVLAGDAERFGVLVRRYRAEFGRYAVHVLGDADAAADAMQEALIRAYDSLADCRDPDRFRPWFFRILANRCRTALSRTKDRAELGGLDLPARERTDQALERRELSEQLGAALARLSDEQRAAFVMKHVDGRSYEEMSDLLGVGVDALKMRVYRARDALRSALEGEA